MYEFEYFSFFVIVKLFSAGNVKKNVFTVFIVPIVTIDGFSRISLSVNTGICLSGQGQFNFYEPLSNPKRLQNIREIRENSAILIF